MPQRLEYLFLLFPTVGAMLFIGGLAYRLRLKGKAAARVQTYGTIVGNDQGLNGEFHPVIEYFIGARRFSITSDTGYGRRKKPGTKSAIMYNPANPSLAFMVQDYYTAANIMLAIGGVFVLLGSLIAWLILARTQ
jgi:hypothetical protein